jgi:hypothetical protein
VDEDAGARRRRRQHEGQDREREDQLEIDRQALAPRALEDRPGQALGQPAAHHRDAHRQHADQEEGHGIGEPLQGVAKAAGGAAERQQRDADEGRDAGLEDLARPE